MEVTADLIKSILNDSQSNPSYFLSYHDHWLSDDEANIAFSMANYQDYEKGLQIEAQIVRFFLYLKDQYQISWFDEDDDSMGDFLNEGEFIEFVVDGLRESAEFVLLVSPLNILFKSAYDKDVAVYCLNKNDQELIEIVKTNNLNLLS